MWSHKKYKELFIGSYGYLKNDRVFQLTSQSGKKIISFESVQQAKKQGWTK